MCLLHKKYYKFGKTGIMINAPRFSEKETLSVFACDELNAPDALVEVRVSENITVPTKHGIVDGDSEFFYDGTEKITIVRSGMDGRILWKAQTSGSDVFAEIAPDREATLNTYEMLRICDLPGIFIHNGSVILHASFIEINGKALLFSGDKQIGKSTQARLWQKYADAHVINGDRVLLEKEKGVWQASGLPFCGTSGICKNETYPVQAVVMLAKGPVNTVMPMSKNEAVFSLLRHCTYDRRSIEQNDLFLDVAGDFITSVPFYSFSCLPDRSAVSALKKVLMEL